MELLRLLANIRNPFLTSFFNIMTYFGEEVVATLIVCISYWCIDKQLTKKIALAFFTSGLFVQNLKITFKIPRPWVIDPAFKPVESAIETATGYSFPSAHTQTSTSIFSTLAFNCKKNILKLSFCLIFILTGISRMYLGVHTPKDVFTAMILSLIISFIIYKLDILNRFTHEKLSLTIFIISCVFIAYSFLQLSFAPDNLALYADAFKTGGSALAFSIGWYLEPKYINFAEKKGSIFFHIIKVILGLTIALALKVCLKPILGVSALGSFTRYFVVILWIMVIYPFLFTQVSKKMYV